MGGAILTTTTLKLPVCPLLLMKPWSSSYWSIWNILLVEGDRDKSAGPFAVCLALLSWSACRDNLDIWICKIMVRGWGRRLIWLGVEDCTRDRSEKRSTVEYSITLCLLQQLTALLSLLCLIVYTGLSSGVQDAATAVDEASTGWRSLSKT